MYPSRCYWLDLLRDRDLRQFVTERRQYSRSYGRRARLFIRWNLRRRLGIGQRELPFPPWLNPEFSARLQLEARFKQQHKRNDENKGWRSMLQTPFWPNFVSSMDPGNTLLPLEIRSPFLDLRLIEYLSRVPPVPWFEGKRLMREAMRGILPEALLHVKNRCRSNSSSVAPHEQRAGPR